MLGPAIAWMHYISRSGINISCIGRLPKSLASHFHVNVLEYSTLATPQYYLLMHTRVHFYTVSQYSIIAACTHMLRLPSRPTEQLAHCIEIMTCWVSFWRAVYSWSKQWILGQHQNSPQFLSSLSLALYIYPWNNSLGSPPHVRSQGKRIDYCWHMTTMAREEFSSQFSNYTYRCSITNSL